jgi:hypothetical protein
VLGDADRDSSARPSDGPESTVSRGAQPRSGADEHGSTAAAMRLTIPFSAQATGTSDGEASMFPEAPVVHGPMHARPGGGEHWAAPSSTAAAQPLFLQSVAVRRSGSDDDEPETGGQDGSTGFRARDRNEGNVGEE